MSTTQRVESLRYFGKLDFRQALAFGAAPGAIMIALAIGFATDPQASRAMSAYMPRTAAQSQVEIAAMSSSIESVSNEASQTMQR